MRCNMFKIQELSSKYEVVKLNENDIDSIYELEYSNPIYFEYMNDKVSKQNIRDDMVALPPYTLMDNKYYIGFKNNKDLVALMDLILHYPDSNTAFIGLFMVDKLYQGKDVGSFIINEFIEALKINYFLHVRLGFIEGNEQSYNFWLKNKFKKTGVKTDVDKYTIVSMNLDI
ncbi:GNAT family N-acetyltransferase [Clostridium botulinum]|nr:GNAT family N-acetyltransferase [Clostridium botulinum]NFS97502.1 GNAT family N-acetyltransferase [Clostridium botulinum]